MKSSLAKYYPIHEARFQEMVDALEADGVLLKGNVEALIADQSYNIGRQGTGQNKSMKCSRNKTKLI